MLYWDNWSGCRVVVLLFCVCGCVVIVVIVVIVVCCCWYPQFVDDVAVDQHG